MKYNLEEVLGKRVKVILNSGEVYIGHADDTSEPEDNQRPYKSLEIFTDDGRGLGFYEDEIKEIIVI